MTRYSSNSEIKRTIQELGLRPMSVNDLDGNRYYAYSLAQGFENYFIDRGFEPPFVINKNGEKEIIQNIPGELTAKDLDALVAKGVLVKGLFAAKTMDVRLDSETVDRLNADIINGDTFRETFLTSRVMAQVIDIFKWSGVKEPEKLTIAADSGASLYVNGERHDTRSLHDNEIAFLQEMETRTANTWFEGVKKIVAEHGFDPDQCPALYVEKKGIAWNVHHRGILEHYLNPQNDPSVEVSATPLDVAIGRFTQKMMKELNEELGPREDGKLVFALTGGQCTNEIRVDKVNKGFGLRAIVGYAMAQEPDKRPTGILNTGDDLYSLNTNGPGTDYHFFILRKDIESEHGIPVRNSHTHHAEGGIFGTVPDMTKDVSCLPDEFEKPEIAIRVPTPEVQNNVVAGVRKPSFPQMTRLYPGAQYEAPKGPSLNWLA